MCDEYLRLFFRWVMNRDPRKDKSKLAAVEAHVKNCQICQEAQAQGKDEVTNVQN